VPVELNTLCGNTIKLVLFFQALINVVALAVAIDGNEVRLLQFNHALLKLLTFKVDWDTHENVIMLLAPDQAFSKLVPKSVSFEIMVDTI